MKSLKKKSSEDLKQQDLKEQINWDEEKAKNFIVEIQKKLMEDRKKFLRCFQLNDLEIEQFVERIEEGEISGEVW